MFYVVEIFWSANFNFGIWIQELFGRVIASIIEASSERKRALCNQIVGLRLSACVSLVSSIYMPRLRRRLQKLEREMAVGMPCDNLCSRPSTTSSSNRLALAVRSVTGIRGLKIKMKNCQASCLVSSSFFSKLRPALLPAQVLCFGNFFYLVFPAPINRSFRSFFWLLVLLQEKKDREKTSAPFCRHRAMYVFKIEPFCERLTSYEL